MAKGISSYKGVWKQEGPAAAELPVLAAVVAEAANAVEEPIPAAEAPQVNIPVPAALLEHRYRLLVLQEHRHKLGRDLLEAGQGQPWQLAWSAVTSLGKCYRAWAHGRFFAIGCYLGVDMAPDVLRQLRHPLQFGRYRRSMSGLWRLLEMLAQKNGQKLALGWAFRMFYGFPPLGMLIYEKQLRVLLAQAHGRSEAAQPAVFAGNQGQ